jgi:hypothetical protein
MDKQARVAYIIAQSALLSARIAAMQAENQRLIAENRPPYYIKEDFDNIIDGEFNGLSHNSVIEYLRD